MCRELVVEFSKVKEPSTTDSFLLVSFLEYNLSVAPLFTVTQLLYRRTQSDGHVSLLDALKSLNRVINQFLFTLLTKVRAFFSTPQACSPPLPDLWTPPWSHCSPPHHTWSTLDLSSTTPLHLVLLFLVSKYNVRLSYLFFWRSFVSHLDLGLRGRSLEFESLLFPLFFATQKTH